jgi:hypothetical protein
MLPPVIEGCPRCKAPMGPSEQFCQACGGDRDAELKILGLELSSLASARKWILGIGFWYVVSAFLELAMVQGRVDPHARDLVLGISFGLCGAHVLLYLWAKKQPFPATVVALVLFITLQLFLATQDPSSIYKGILIKIVFVVVLVKAVQAGYEVHRLRGKRA